MLKVYSAWGLLDGDRPHLLIRGEERLRFADGTLDPDCQRLLWRIDACSWEEAKAIYNLRQGWEPFKPPGRPEPCADCGSVMYPEGSGECWSCGREHQQ